MGAHRAPAATAWNSPRAGNPLIPGYFADPCSQKFGDTYYIYVTPDGWDVGKGPAGAWTSKDFVHWTWHPMNWPRTEFKWAPSVVQRAGKYYMFNSIPCQIWGAVADSPLGPWTNLVGEGQPMIPDQTPKETITLDGECFIDDDGQAYLWYGTWWRPTVAKLKPDMHSIEGEPIQYFKNPRNPNPPMGLVQRCMEGPYLFKRQGTYYLMYSDDMCQDSTYNVKYSTSKSPLGPWTYDPARNPILETTDDGTVDGPGHHSMFVDGGKVYIVYHRHDNPHDPDGAHRQTCVDELYFDADGSIEKVRPSHLGVGYLAPSTKRDANLALGKPARASSLLSFNFRPEYAVDENNGTLWKAASSAYPQWLEVDLGKTSPVRRVETEFQYPPVANRYLIEVSTDGQSWQKFADRTENKEPGVMLDRGEAEARYVRITLLGQNSGRPDQWAALWGFRVYDGRDQPNQAPVVQVGPDRELSFRFPKFGLEAAVHDDGLPNGPVSVRWSQVSGPGQAVFTHPDRCRTEATVDQPGRYLFKLTADDGALQGAGQVTVSLSMPTERVIAYGFDEESGGMVSDSSGNGQNGILRKGPTRSYGPHGKAVNLDGVDDYVAVPPLGELKEVTIATWLNLHSVRSEPSSLLCSEGKAPGALRLLVNGDGAVQFGIEGQPAQSSDYRFTPEQVGEWRHLAVTCDRAARTVSFYVDGKLDATRTLTEAPALNLSAGLRLGGADAGARCLDGELDDFRVYEKALGATDIAALAARPQLTRIAEAQKLPDGASVLLVSKPVTLAAANPLSFERATDYFYVSELDGSAGIRVEDGKFRPDRARADVLVSLAGVLRTKASGERYVELTTAPSLGASRAVSAVPAKPGAAARASASLVRIEGVVKEVAADGESFTMTDSGGGAPEVKAVVERFTPVKKFSPGNTVSVAGLFAPEGGRASEARHVLLVRELTRLNPPPSPALALYSFDEPDGEVAKDSSSNTQDARLVNSPKRVQGKQGRALRLDGAKSYVQVPDLGLQPALTIAGWVNLASPGQDNFASSILHSDGWNLGDLHFMVVKETGRIRAALNGVGDLDSKFAFTGDRLGQWAHVALTFDAQARRFQLYVNAQLDATAGIQTPRPVNLSHAKIGSWDGRSRMWDGMVDEFQFYDRALQPDEIAKLFRGELLEQAR